MKHKMWSRLLSMALAVMMITSIVPNSAFAEAASEITNSTSQVQVEETPVVENDVPQDEVTVPEEETPVESVEPTAEPTADPMAEPTAEPTQAPEATAVPSEQPSAEPTAAPEATETPNASAQPSESPAPSATPAPSASPLPSETPVPTETPAATEEPVAMNEEAYETTVNVEGADITVTVNVPAGALPVDAKLVAQMIAQDSEEYAEVEAALADETLNEQPVEYDGMIALDIRFEMNGEEIEPAQPVEVTIDAKAMLPEDADPETVTVQHLEENENGEVTAVKTVADATEQTAGDVTVEEAQAEEPTMDMASTFAVDGFSSFTITWSENRYVTVYYVSEQGDQLEATRENVSVQKDSSVDLENYRSEISGYTFSGTVYLNYGPAEDGEEIEASSIRYNSEDKKWQYSQGYYSQWEDWTLPQGLTERRAFLVYTELQEAKSVETVDTRGKITINLFDYDADYERSYGRLTNDNEGINNGHTLKFKTRATGHTGYVHPNYWTGLSNNGDQGGVFQGIVQNKLQNGYPVLQANNSWNKTNLNGIYSDGGREVYQTYNWNPQNESLAYLFDGTSSNGVEKTVLNANKLFQMNADGYYYYDSSKNAATINSQTGEFTVYNKASSVGFNPFVENWGDGLNEFFGMTVETDFIMPKDRLVNGKEMVFEFSGDDDVWVFVDDVLVLDMGGIHAAVSGSINFTTGDVVINNVNSGTRNESGPQSVQISQLFQNAGKKWDDSDYKGHTLKFFYLERGGNVSNCKIQFNLPVVPKNSLMVTKTLDSSGDVELDQYLASLLNYRFRVVDAADTSVVRIEENTPYEIYKNGVPTGRRDVVGPDGVFTLKKDETAVFSSVFEATDEPYIVQELVPDGAEGQFQEIQYEVNSSGGIVISQGSSGIEVGEDTFTGYNSGVIDPAELDNGGAASVTFNNTVTTDENKLSILKISKELADGAQPTNETFIMEVNINGEPLPEKTTYVVTDKGATEGKTEKVDTEGQIILKAGQTATLLMLAGNDFSVKELSFNTQNYNFVKYQLNGADQTNTQNTPVTGTLMSTMQEVTVVNSRLKGDVTITKTIKGSENFKEGDLDKVKQGLSFALLKDGTEVDTVPATAEGFSWKTNGANLMGTYTFYNMDNGNYTVKESVGNGTPSELTLTVKVDEAEVPLTDGGYSSQSKPLNGAQSISFVFENAYAPANGTIVIQKTVTGLENDSAALEELKAELSFEVTGPNGYKQTESFNEFKKNPVSGVYELTISDVPVGSYTVTESGYDQLELYNWVENGSEITDNAMVTGGSTGTAALANVYEKATGSLTITKNLIGDLKKGDEKAVFTFKITGPDGVVYFQTVTVDSSNTGSATINNLPAGDYTVEELTNVDYSLADRVANPRPAVIEHSNRFKGEVSFVNGLTGTGLTDDSVVVNTFKKTENGIVVKQQEWINQKPNPNNTPEE